MRAVIITLTLWSLVLCVTSAVDECPKKQFFTASIKIGRKCVYYPASYEYSKTYHDARAYCQSQHTQLISVHSDREMRAIMTFVRQQTYRRIGGVWLGLRRRLVDNMRARWDDGTPLDYVNWKAKVDRNEMEQCVFVRFTPYEGRYGDGTWEYVNCNDEMSFLCMAPLNDIVPSSSTLAPPVTGRCRESWSEFGNTCYFVNQNAVTFQEADKQCKSWNSYLASVHSDEEQNYITALVGEYSSDNVWIGYKRCPNGNFIAVSNEKVDKTNWLYGRPIPLFSKNDCVSVIKSNTLGGNWIDLPCNITLASICKKPKEPVVDTPLQRPFASRCQNNSNYINYANACYKVYWTQLMTFNEAELKCKQDGGHLLSLNSAHEHALLKYLMQRVEVRKTWIGMSGMKKDYEIFRWLDQKPMYFTNWAAGQPSKSNLTQCVYQNEVGDWYATDCGELKSFACKIGKIDERPKDQQRRCPNSARVNWIDADHGSNYCYSYFKGSGTFTSAQSNCSIHDANLVSIHSEHELKLLPPLVKIQRHPNVGGNSGYVWIGLRKTQKNNFHWVDDSPMDFTNWPQNMTHIPSGSQLCGIMHLQSLKWEHNDCEAHYSYICSIPKVPMREITP